MYRGSSAPSLPIHHPRTSRSRSNQVDLVHRRLRPWLRWANLNNLQLRVEETNTLAIQGLAGASDTLAAALFYVDYALTLVQAGVHGMNFHDSWCSAYSAIVFPSVSQHDIVKFVLHASSSF